MVQLQGVDPIQQPAHVPIGQRLIELNNLGNQNTLDQQKIASNSLSLKQQQDAAAEQAASDAVIAKGGSREDMIAGMSKVGTTAYTNFQKYLSQVDTDKLNQTKTQLDISKAHADSMGKFVDATRGKESDTNTPLVYKHFKDSLVASGDPLAKTLPDTYDPNYLAQYDDAGKQIKQLADQADAETKKREDKAKADEEAQKLVNDKLTAKETQAKIDNAGQTDDLKEFNQSGYYKTYLRDNKIDPSTLNKDTEDAVRGQAFIAFKQAQLKDNNPTEWSLALKAAGGDPVKALRIANDSKQEGSSITPGTLDMLATQFAKSGELPPLGMGSAAAGDRRAIFNRANELFPNVDIATNKADYAANKRSEQSLQQSGDQIASFENTAGKNLDLFLGTAKKVVDSGSPLINRPWRSIDKNALGVGDVSAFDAARQVAVNEIAKVTSNPGLTGQLSDAARKEVESFIPADASLRQIYDVANILKADMKNRRDSINDQLTEIRKRTSQPASQTGASSPSALPAPSIPASINPFRNGPKPTSNAVPTGNIDVQIPGQKPGIIPAEKWEAFKKKYPNAIKLSQ